MFTTVNQEAIKLLLLFGLLYMVYVRSLISSAPDYVFVHYPG